MDGSRARTDPGQPGGRQVLEASACGVTWEQQKQHRKERVQEMFRGQHRKERVQEMFRGQIPLGPLIDWT